MSTAIAGTTTVFTAVRIFYLISSFPTEDIFELHVTGLFLGEPAVYLRRVDTSECLVYRLTFP